MSAETVQLLSTFSNIFWSESVWLPPNLTWADVRPRPGSNSHTRFEDLWLPLPVGFTIIFLRAAVMKRWIKPLGLHWGLKDSTHKRPPDNEVLEDVHKSLRSSEKPDLHQLSQQLAISERRIQRWLKQRKLFGKPTTMDKFCETGWRFCYYAVISLYGAWCLWDKSWLWNIRNCW